MYIGMHNKACICVQGQAWIWNSKFESDCMKFSPFWLQNQDFTLDTEKLLILLLPPPVGNTDMNLSSLQQSPLKTGIKPKGHWNIRLPSTSPNNPEIVIFYCTDATLGKHLERAPHFWLDDSRRNRWKEATAADSVAGEVTVTQHEAESALERTLVLPDRLAKQK